MNNQRCRRLVDEAIKDLSLDLTGLTVLTEAATGLFAMTASVASLAGAKQVMVMGKDSRFGSAKEATDATLDLAREWGCIRALSVVENRSDPVLSEADIVTNLAGVRPIDAELIGRLKSTAVIPLMFEAWEYRPEDIDLNAARARQLMVMGTNEDHPEVDVLSYLGPLACKLFLEASIELYGSRIAVLGSGVFLDKAVTYLKQANAEVAVIEVDKGGSYSADVMRESLKNADGLLVVEHHNKSALLGADAPLSEREISEINQGLVVAHITGNLNRENLVSAGMCSVPGHFAPPGYMSVTTAYVGPKPLIRLHAGGLKVGEIMARARQKELSFTAAVQRLSEHELCQEVF